MKIKTLIMSCEKHKRTIEKYNGSLLDLVTEIGDLHYEELIDFLRELSNKLKEDSTKDLFNGRIKLAKSLREASNNVFKASIDICDAWNISKPFMK